MIPRLLVSVRNRTEAQSALRGGAGIVDVKEPSHGALGMASPAEIRAVHEEVLAWNRSATAGTLVGFSIALGECCDWEKPEDAAKRPRPGLDPEWFRTALLKIGVAGLLNPNAYSPGAGEFPPGMLSGNGQPSHTQNVAWLQRLKLVRTRIRRDSVASGTGISETVRPWVSVAYADAERCQAPSVLDIANAAANDPTCSGLLIDTAVKDQTGLLGWMNAPQLHQVREITRAAGIILALAGQLSRDRISCLVPFQPDVIGVRGAVCDAGNRERGVQESLIHDLRQHIAAVFEHEGRARGSEASSG